MTHGAGGELERAKKVGRVSGRGQELAWVQGVVNRSRPELMVKWLAERMRSSRQGLVFLAKVWTERGSIPATGLTFPRKPSDKLVRVVCLVGDW